MDDILTPLYEPEFLGFSYGFRPGRGAHDALDALAFGIERRKVNWIIDADIRAFFDRLSRDHLLQVSRAPNRGPTPVLRLIAKWLNAGVMEGDEWKDDLQGTPQGAVVSPILANVYRALCPRPLVRDARRSGATSEIRLAGDTITVPLRR